MSTNHQKPGYTKRAYDLPDGLIKALEDLVAPSKNYSPDVCGAILVWCGLPVTLREQAKKVVEAPNTLKVIQKIKKMVAESLLDEQTIEFLRSLSTEDRRMVLQDAQQAKEKVSHKKKAP